MINNLETERKFLSFAGAGSDIGNIWLEMRYNFALFPNSEENNNQKWIKKWTVYRGRVWEVMVLHISNQWEYFLMIWYIFEKVFGELKIWRMRNEQPKWCQVSAGSAIRCREKWWISKPKALGIWCFSHSTLGYACWNKSEQQCFFDGETPWFSIIRGEVHD